MSGKGGSKPTPETEAIVEDALFLLSVGTDPDTIPQRVGRSRGAIRALLKRRGLHDAANHFYPRRWA